MSPRTRMISLTVAAAAALTIIIVFVLVFLAPRIGGIVSKPDSTPGPDYAVAAQLPPPAVTATRGGIAGLADAAWVKRVSATSGIPSRALAAYVGAALAKSQSMPSCALGWTTLAGIGSAESDHGRHGGSSVGEDGTVTPPILGIALDGESASHIPDSDGGVFDGDAKYDRAVGPMQLIPQTWRNWHTDANGDGIEDPQNIDDAVMATANYLCRASGDMASRDGWRAGVLAYNGSDVYAQTVANAANRYAAAAAEE